MLLWTFGEVFRGRNRGLTHYVLKEARQHYRVLAKKMQRTTARRESGSENFCVNGKDAFCPVTSKT